MPQANTISAITPATFQVQFALAASQAINSNLNAVFIESPGAASKATERVPPEEVWSLTRLYCEAALTVNLRLGINVDGTAQKMNSDTSVMVITSSTLNPVNPFAVHMIIDSGQEFYFTGNTDAANGTTAITENIDLDLIRYPVSIAQQLNAKGIPL